MQLVPTDPEGTMVERIEPATEVAALERIEIERIQILVTEAQANVVPTSKAALISTPILHPAIAIASQDNLATPSTAKTLLLLTTRPKFDRTITKDGSESMKSSAGHTEKLLSKEPSTTDVLPNATEVQIDLILANQQTIMANQHALERQMDKMESLILQMLKALQKRNSKDSDGQSSMILTHLLLMSKGGEEDKSFN